MTLIPPKNIYAESRSITLTEDQLREALYWHGMAMAHKAQQTMSNGLPSCTNETFCGPASAIKAAKIIESNGKNI